MSSNLQLAADQLLTLHNRKAHVKGNTIWLCCPYHGGGGEVEPSCKVNLDEGSKDKLKFYCFGCRKKGHYNLLAETLGLEQIETDYEQTGRRTLRFKEVEADGPIEVPDKSFAWNKNFMWRNISGKLLNKIGGRALPARQVHEDPRLWLPSINQGEIVGYITCLPRPVEGSPTYLNSPGTWRNSSLFMLDYVKETFDRSYPLTIVEGPRDCLHLLQNGVPAVAVLGSYLSEEQKELLVHWQPRYVLAGSDGDSAGDLLKDSILELGDRFPCYNLNWGHKKDPCGLFKQTDQIYL